MGFSFSHFYWSRFFVLLETSITKGFKAAITLDFGIVFSDIVYILIAYFASNQILDQFKNNPNLYIIGGLIMGVYGAISFIQLKKNLLLKRKKILMIFLKIIT